MFPRKLYLQFRDILPKRKPFARAITCYQCPCMGDIEAFYIHQGCVPTYAFALWSLSYSLKILNGKIASETNSSQLQIAGSARQHYEPLDHSLRTSWNLNSASPLLWTGSTLGNVSWCRPNLTVMYLEIRQCSNWSK